MPFQSQVDGASGYREFPSDHRRGHFAEALTEPVAIIEFGWATELLLGTAVPAFNAVLAHGGVDHLRVHA